MRGILRWALVLAFGASLVVGSGTAMAGGLGDYRWASRPLLVFAPTADDPRLADTLSRIAASRCDFVNRDMVLGELLGSGTSMLDGRALDTDDVQQLRRQFGIDENAFTVVLIGKDGGEKYRVTGVPDLRVIYAVIDGMPMRSRETSDDPGRC